MDLSITQEQEMLKKTARDFMQRESPKQALLALEKTETGFTPGLWNKVAQLGWLGLAIPEKYGGGGASLTDNGVLFEELGRGPLFGPFFSSGVLGAFIILEAGTEEQKQRLLPAICAGRSIVTLALTEPEYGWGAGSVRMAAASRDGRLTLNGVKLFVADAAGATHFICAVRAPDGVGGISLVMVDKRLPGISVRNLSGFLGWAAEVKFDSVQVPGSEVLGVAGKGWPALERAMQRAIPVLCAYQVGGCQAVFEMSVEYSRTRMQFGQAIGRFQRVQDHIIELVNQLDAARWTTYEALWKLDAGKPAAASVHLAKAVASTAYHMACLHAHEVHAGTGSVTEYGLAMHTKTSRTLYDYLGSPDHHRRLLADALEL